MIYIRTSTFNARQKEWLQQASEAERRAFWLLAPLRLWFLHTIDKDGVEALAYLPTLHGIPVGLEGNQDTWDNPDLAWSAGMAFLERMRQEAMTSGEGLSPLDLDALGIGAEPQDEFTMDSFLEDVALAASEMGEEGRAMLRALGRAPAKAHDA